MSLCSWLLRSRGKILIVFHTEGLANGRIVSELKSFGKELDGIRPLLAVVTPMSPMYHIDPIRDPIRRRIRGGTSTSSSRQVFASRLQDLQSYFDIGYHGHFFKNEGGFWHPSFDLNTIANQFDEECKLLSDFGFRPVAYSGGWWYMSTGLAGLLDSFGFEIDTTLNDIRMDSFGRRQPYSRSPLGRPFRLFRSVAEIPTVRSDANFLQLTLSVEQPTYFAVSLHDYNLLRPPFTHSFHKVARRLMARGAFVETGEIISLYHSGRLKIPA